MTLKEARKLIRLAADCPLRVERTELLSQGPNGGWAVSIQYVGRGSSIAYNLADASVQWKDLIVTGEDGYTYDTLGDLLNRAPANLDGATFDEKTGGITAWPDFFLSAEGEDPGWDTPRCPVDWDGFRAAFQEALT